MKAHVNINNFKRGPGFWKFNSSLLSETEFVNKAENFIETHFGEYQNDNPVVAWEMFELKFKSFCLQYTSNRSKNKKNIIKKLILELNKTEQQLASEPQNRELQRQTLHLKKHLELQEMKQIQGAQVRSRLRWIEEGEKNTKYFLRLEKHRSASNTISNLQIGSGYTDDPTTILGEIRSCYVNLYKQNEPADSNRKIKTHFLADEIFPTLSDEERAECDKAISNTELTNALNLLNKD